MRRTNIQGHQISPAAKEVYFESLKSEPVKDILDRALAFHPSTYEHLTDTGLALAQVAVLDTELSDNFEAQIELTSAGLVHDCGKEATQGITVDILDSTEKLSDDSRAQIDQHPVEGYKVLQAMGLSRLAVTTLMHHRFQAHPYSYPSADKFNRLIAADGMTEAVLFDDNGRLAKHGLSLEIADVVVARKANMPRLYNMNLEPSFEVVARDIRQDFYRDGGLMHELGQLGLVGLMGVSEQTITTLQNLYSA